MAWGSRPGRRQLCLSSRAVRVALAAPVRIIDADLVPGLTALQPGSGVAVALPKRERAADGAAGSEPDDGRGLLSLGHQLPRLGVLEDGLGRGLAGLLHQHVRLVALGVAGERDALKGEFLGDEVGDDAVGETQAGGWVDASLRIVVGRNL
ncbi:hypothetical protein [Streptomyces zagrosensis]|uniref:hypothetical protein n=1 Tax=Streptomyces zagrosensis TaxID=1042984 RepID=UPI00162170BB|nr:hypothetical protein [Streptomyces zagrosensis]